MICFVTLFSLLQNIDLTCIYEQNILFLKLLYRKKRNMKNWKLKLGDFLFTHRSFTPIPLIVLVFIFFKPLDLEGKNILLNVAGLLVSLIGEMIRIISVGYAHSGTSGRESYLRAENLNTSGIYSFVRNPLYIGNFFMFCGLILVFSNIFALMIFAFFLILQYYFVILTEEDFLRKEYGADYENYCSQIKRIMPVLNKYKKNQNPFDLKKVIFKENDSVFNLFMMYLLILLYKERVFYGVIARPLFYVVPGGFLLIAYIIIKIIKKRV